MGQPLAPDAGMAELAARMFAGHRMPGQEDPPGPNSPGYPGDETLGDLEAGSVLQIMAKLAVSLGSAAAEMRRNREALKIPWKYCHPIPLNPITETGAGVISDERWEPRAEWAWQITRISIQSNQSGGATSAIIAQDSIAPGGVGAWNLQSFPPAGTTITAGGFMGCWEPKGKFLLPGNRLVLSSTGGGVIANGEAIEIALDWLATYLM